MASATAEIGAAQDLELDGGSQNPMTPAEAAIPEPLPGAASTIVGLIIAAVVIGRRRDGDITMAIPIPENQPRRGWRVFTILNLFARYGF